MTTIATGHPAPPDPTARTAGSESDWIRPRTTPDGDLMPGEDSAADDGGLGFGDLLDVINPLQHLPVVGTIYRALTGDTMSEAARMAGGALYGGPFGIIGALANVVVDPIKDRHGRSILTVRDQNTFAEQLRQMKNMGGMSGLLGMMPGVGKMKGQLAAAGFDD